MLKRLLLCLAFAAPACAATPPPIVDIAPVAAAENAGAMPFIITKAKAKSYTQIRVQTVDGTARAGTDYTAIDKTLTLGNNTTSSPFPVPLIDNTTYQGTRTFSLKLTVLRFGQVPASYTPIVGTINDDELPPVATGTKTCPSGQIIYDLPGLVCNPRPPVPPLTMHGVTFGGLPAIPDNFDLVATSAVTYSDPFNTAAGTWYGGLPAHSDEGGNFRFACLAGHLNYDDALVLFGQSHAAHLHQYWGNTETNANSTYTTLRTTGQTTCSNPLNGPANRTAYWAPAMLDGVGNVVKPDFISAYYKQHPASDPACTDTPGGACVGLPNGLGYTFGANIKTGTDGPTDPNTPVFYMIKWTCNKDEAGNAAIPGSFHTIADMVAAGCPAGAKIFLNFVAPDCWDGKNVDTPDHRSNMSYPTRATPNGFRCPLDHPYWTPNYSGFIVYTTDANFVAGKWRLSSDDALAMMTGQPVPAGATAHFDYMEAWSPAVKATWQFYCINQSLNCAGGELGDGTAMNHDDLGPRATHVLVPLNSIP